MLLIHENEFFLFLQIKLKKQNKQDFVFLLKTQIAVFSVKKVIYSIDNIQKSLQKTKKILYKGTAVVNIKIKKLRNKKFIYK